MRGNQRTSGELSRREGGKIFGSGSRTPIAITILVKKAGHTGKADIFYHDIGDYLTREDKLKIISNFGSILSPAMQLSSIVPNQDNDWLNQRDGLFETFVAIGDKDDKKANTIFVPYYSRGCASARDAWVYNFSKPSLERNISSMIDIYNSEAALCLAQAQHCLERDPKLISWSGTLEERAHKGLQIRFSGSCLANAMYRPFCTQAFYYDKPLLERTYQLPKIFPTPQTENLVICVSGIAGKTFSTLMTNCIPDLHILESGTQCFPLYWYEKQEPMQLGLFDKVEGEYIRRDGISDFALQHARELYGPKTTREDIFYYVYGLLHSPDYRQRFEADLTKMLPRIPFVEATATFKQLSSIGRQLAELHLNYESVDAWSELIVLGDGNNFAVTKMRFGKDGKADDKRVIWLNDTLRVENIPLRAYDYVINGKSAIEWLMERYAVTKDKDSGIVNDANAWGLEHNNPKYILELLCRIVTVSMKTLELIGKLPHLEFS